MKILVFAPDESISAYLSVSGYDVAEVYSVELVAQAAEKREVDIVVYMPAAAPDAITQHQHRANIKALRNICRVILVTASEDPLLPWSVAVGVHDILLTPLELPALLYRIQHPATLDDATGLLEKLSGPSERLHEKVDSQEQVGGHDTGQGAEEPRREIKLPRLEVKLPEIKLPEIKFSKREDRAQLKRERDAELAQTEISAAEDYLCKIIDIRTRRVITPLKICVVSPCATGVTFVSCNLAYYLAQKKKQVMLLGDEDCLEYLGNNRQNITLGYSSGQYDVAIVDTHAPHEADLYVLVYTPDLHYIPKIKQMELTISGPKLRMLNKSQPMPISNEKILGFKPDAVIPAINNPRQILLARPAVLDYKEVQNAFTTIFQKIGGFFCDSEGQISQYAGN